MKTGMMQSAFDFETVEGNAVVIAYDDGDFIEFPTIDQILAKFTKDHRKHRYFSYNLRF